MRVTGLKTVKLSGRWLRSRLLPGTLVLGYHSIAEPMGDAHPLCVTPQHFGEQLQVLSQLGRVISLRGLVRSLQEGLVPKRAVVLTFDDGYADILQHARPLLERYQAAATVFVTTGSLGREFWWDRLERLLLAPTALPEQLSLSIEDGSYQWLPGAGPRAGKALGSRQDVVRSAYDPLLLLSPEKREKALAALEAWSGRAADHVPARRALTGEELLELASGELFEIGAHSVTHPFLADLPSEAQRAEIQESKVHLEELLSRPVTSFAYPNGSSSPSTRALVREYGFDCACSSHKDMVGRWSDRFQLPRLWVQDWDGDAFSRWLRLWLPR
jgi:peptidoglycan/xylan/chitin deacetylase (PgdA/CDA1 family)